ncbi:DNA polymerase I [compost metagenome]
MAGVESTSIAITREAPAVSKTNVLVWIAQEDRAYLSRLTPMFAGCNTRAYDKAPDAELPVLVAQCKQAGFTSIVTTRLDVLLKLLPPGRVKKATLANYTGSFIPYDGVKFLILPPLKQLVTVEYAEWLFKQLCRKVTAPQEFRVPTDFDWWVASTERELEGAYQILSRCDLISVDCETVKEPRPSIKLVQYTGFHFASNKSWTFVIPMESMAAVYAMRRINALEIWKVLQNGKYDCAYFFAYSAPMHSYLYDLKNAMHAQLSELPKDLAFSSALWILDIMYWKDLSESGDKQDQYRYGALDTWATGEAFIGWLAQAPDWAKRNYVTEFSLVPSLHMCEMRGLKRDMAALYKAADYEEGKVREVLSFLQATIHPKFNPRSPLQCAKLICLLTGKKYIAPTKKVKDMTWEEKRARQMADKKEMEKASFAHPLNERILGGVIEYRKRTKSISNYLTTGEEAKEFGPAGKERILFSINPDATDTGRHASKAHHFWCGFNIQNVKGGNGDGELELASVKETIVADDGFYLAEADYEQAEDRGVAYKSGDPTLLDIFATGKDSHSFKAAMFFGIPYNEIYDEATGKKLNKPIRELGKRINHGANYNMGAYVLLETMGPKSVREAQGLLKLPRAWSLIQVCEYLLLQYEKAFPVVKKDYYKSIILQIKQTRMLISDTGWVRYCFGNPEASKPALNKYVAHVTQNLNAMILNKAWLKIFRKLGFNPHFKLHAQIHDSILFQYRIGHDYLLTEVKELMTFPVPVKDCKGVQRELIVPVDVKRLGRTWAGTNE